MNALANPAVGEYFKDHFVNTYQKVGTFTVKNGIKVGGNVACYFTTHDGQVLHAVAGPVNSRTLLREARWVTEAMNRARLEKHDVTPKKLRAFFHSLHAERLYHEFGLDPRYLPPPQAVIVGKEPVLPSAGDARTRLLRGNKQGQVHVLLAAYPLAPLERVYPVVFQGILGERVSSLPVAVN